jgi:hypothetical protein
MIIDKLTSMRWIHTSSVGSIYVKGEVLAAFDERLELNSDEKLKISRKDNCCEGRLASYRLPSVLIHSNGDKSFALFTDSYHV